MKRTRASPDPSWTRSARDGGSIVTWRSFRARAKERDPVQRIRIEIDITKPAVAGDPRDASIADDETRPEQLRRTGQIAHDTSRHPGVVRQLHEPAIRLRCARQVQHSTGALETAASQPARSCAASVGYDEGVPVSGRWLIQQQWRQGLPAVRPRAARDLERSPGAGSNAFVARRRAPPRAVSTCARPARLSARAPGSEEAHPVETLAGERRRARHDS